jgi:hypothetical protein
MTLIDAPALAEPRDLAPPPRTLAIGKGALLAWLENAEPGSRIEYHRGFLLLDRHRGFSPFPEHRRRELVALADRLLALAGTGWVLLVQERHGECDYSYVAIKAKRRAPCQAIAIGRFEEVSNGAPHRHG